MLVVEQAVDLALSIADRAYVLKLGRVVAHDTAEALLQAAKLHELYLGGGSPADSR